MVSFETEIGFHLFSFSHLRFSAFYKEILMEIIGKVVPYKYKMVSYTCLENNT
jgi:hypothetical protein